MPVPSVVGAGKRLFAARRLLGAGAVLVAAGVGALGASAVAAPLTPQSDPFYRPPQGFGAHKPGSVLRSRPVSTAAFGVVPERVRAWQVLYRTTDTQGRPEATVATVLEPLGPRPRGLRPLVAYQEAEDSLGSQCAPSYELLAGAPSTNGVEQVEILLIDGLLEHGWAVVVPDYEGPTSAYGAGIQAARATLDSIRAAERFRPAGLAGARTPVAMWGYSGGALATAWASEQQPRYAPELNVRGVAEGGVPVNIANAARVLNKGLFAGYFLAGMVGISRQYPRLAALLQTILTPEGRAAAQQVGTMCNSDIVNRFAFKDVTRYTSVPDPLSLPVARRIIAADSLSQRQPTAPLYIYHAINDELLPSRDVDGLVARYCKEGVSVQYTRDIASEHIVLVATAAPGALAWLGDRLGNPARPAPKGCTTTTTLSAVLPARALTSLVAFLAGLVTVL
jgi:hypothetical protein